MENPEPRRAAVLHDSVPFLRSFAWDGSRGSRGGGHCHLPRSQARGGHGRKPDDNKIKLVKRL